MDKGEVALGDTDDIAGRKGDVAVDLLVADEGAVPAFQVSQGPNTPRDEDFSVVSAGPFILYDDLVGGRPANGHGSAGDQTEYVGPLITLANDQIGKHWWDLWRQA